MQVKGRKKGTIYGRNEKNRAQDVVVGAAERKRTRCAPQGGQAGSAPKQGKGRLGVGQKRGELQRTYAER
jgi:hypothetical protein